jgi:hypothetical protein
MILTKIFFIQKNKKLNYKNYKVTNLTRMRQYINK